MHFYVTSWSAFGKIVFLIFLNCISEEIGSYVYFLFYDGQRENRVKNGFPSPTKGGEAYRLLGSKKQKSKHLFQTSEKRTRSKYKQWINFYLFIF